MLLVLFISSLICVLSIIDMYLTHKSLKKTVDAGVPDPWIYEKNPVIRKIYSTYGLSKGYRFAAIVPAIAFILSATGGYLLIEVAENTKLAAIIFGTLVGAYLLIIRNNLKYVRHRTFP